MPPSRTACSLLKSVLKLRSTSSSNYLPCLVIASSSLPGAAVPPSAGAAFGREGSHPLLLLSFSRWMASKVKAPKPWQGGDRAALAKKAGPLASASRAPASRSASPAAAPRAQPPLASVSNDAIREAELRVIFPDGSNRILSRQAALDEARVLRLDLVLVQSKTTPAVARITSLARLRGELIRVAQDKVAEQRRLARGAQPNEVHFSAVIAPHDASVKLGIARSWLRRHRKAALFVEAKDVATATERAQQMVEALADVGTPEQPPKPFKGSPTVKLVMQPHPPLRPPKSRVATAAAAVAVEAEAAAAVVAARSQLSPLSAPTAPQVPAALRPQSE